MAIRTPLILDGSNDFIEMSTAQIDAVKDRCRYLYGESPSVTLAQVADSGNLGAISDTHLISGTSHVSTTSFVPETSTGEPQEVNHNFAKIEETRANTTTSVDTNLVAFPVFQNGGNIQAMTLTDVYDTFIEPAIDTLTSGNGQPGTYYIHTSTTLTGYSAVSQNLIFRDTRADIPAYTAAGIGVAGTTQDLDEIITSYFLLAANNIPAPSMEQMLFIRNSDKDIEQYTQAEMDLWLQNCMRHAASEITGTSISYNLNGNGTNLGTGMANTILTGSGNHQTRFVNADDYRAQEFPNGTAATAATHRLRIDQV